MDPHTEPGRRVGGSGAARSSLRERILARLSEIETVDSHSHSSLECQYYKHAPLSLFYFMDYFSRELAGLGDTTDVDASPNEEEKWEHLRWALGRAGNVTYWRYKLITFRDLFGLKDMDVTDDNWRSLNETIKLTTKDRGWYRHVVQDRCRLRTQVRNVEPFEDWEPIRAEAEYFTPVVRTEPCIRLHSANLRRQVEEHTGVEIRTLKAAKEAVRRVVEGRCSDGAVGIKLGHAYGRSLHSVAVEETRAASLLDRVLCGEEVSDAEQMEFQDHMIFYLAELAGELGLVFQIHTGVQSLWGHIPDSDPLLLIPLLSRYRNTKFDLFHAGFPYSREMGMLGKHYPNVWLNMCFMHLLSPAASRQILSEWIDLVPGFRILGFGADLRWPESIYGHLVLARECLADVLTEKVARDYLSEEEALRLAVMFFRDNGLELYGLTP